MLNQALQVEKSTSQAFAAQIQAVEQLLPPVILTDSFREAYDEFMMHSTGYGQTELSVTPSMASDAKEQVLHIIAMLKEFCTRLESRVLQNRSISQ